jgi:Rrf2 family protein
VRHASLQLPLTARYALAAVTMLATLGPGERASSGKLAEETGVPGPFLAKILAQLARADVVSGTRGRGGGYALARSPHDITLGEVLDALGDAPEDEDGPVCVLRNKRCAEAPECELHSMWTNASAPMAKMLATMTVADVAGLERGC